MSNVLVMGWMRHLGIILAGIMGAMFPFLTITRAEHLCNSRDQLSFFRKCRSSLTFISRSSELFRPKRVFYRELVKGVTKDPLRDLTRLAGGRVSLILIIGNSGGLSQQLFFKFSLTWLLVRDSLSLFITCLAVLQDCEGCDLGIQETASQAFYLCP